EVATHGGSLRVYVCHEAAARREQPGLSLVRNKEQTAGLDRPEGYEGFAARVEAVRRGFVEFLEHARRQGHRVVAYGAAAKGNTLLNVCGIGRDRITFVADRSPAKQGRLLPG